MFNGQKVLVTGGTGMIGRQLVSLLVNRGAQVSVVSLDTPVGLPPGVEFLKADLTYFDKCLEICDTVINNGNLSIPEQNKAIYFAIKHLDNITDIVGD